MSDLLAHRGYQGTVEYSSENQVLFGKVLHIDSLLMYESESATEIQKAFQETVDDYLSHCEKHSINPNKPYKGSLNVRIGPERHRALAHMAARESITLNELLCKGADLLLAPIVTTHEHNHTHVHVLDITSRTQSMVSAGHTAVILGSKSEGVTTNVH